MPSNRSIVRIAAQVARRPAARSSLTPSFAAVAPRNQQRQISTRLLATSASAHIPRVAAPFTINSRPRTSARTYSQDAAADGEGKIWSFEEVKSLVSGDKSDIVIVDTREPGELQDTGRIPGAVNVPIKTQPDSFHISEDEFEDRFGYPRPAKDAEVVFYCKAGVRSRAAAQLARSAGWTKTGEYPGSWLDWVAKGGKIQR